MAEVYDGTDLRYIYRNACNEEGYQVEAINDEKGAGFVTMWKQAMVVWEVLYLFLPKVKKSQKDPSFNPHRQLILHPLQLLSPKEYT